MNRARFDSIMANQTATARKVYAAIPISESWTIQQICSELMRLGTPVEHRVTSGCIAALLEANVITAVTRDQFRRVPVKDKPVAVKSLKEVPALMAKDTPPAEAPVPAPVVSIPAVDRLVHMADALNTTGQMLIKMSDDLTDIADSITRTSEADATNLQRLRQLQELLRGIGMATS